MELNPFISAMIVVSSAWIAAYVMDRLKWFRDEDDFDVLRDAMPTNGSTAPISFQMR